MVTTHHRARAPSAADGALHVVLFTGGRGSSVLSRQLVNNPAIKLTLAINGYDDGGSTGEVRRFLGDCLGPSDFRKNASRLAHELRSCDPALVDLLDQRLPANTTSAEALVALRWVEGLKPDEARAGRIDLAPVLDRLDTGARTRVATWLRRFREELAGSPAFDFADCSVGNLVFAGAFLEAGRDFLSAVDRYCQLLGLPVGLIESVTDGTDGYLVAIDVDDRFLGSEGAIVDATRRNRIKDIYLIDWPLTSDEAEGLASMPPAAAATLLEERAPVVRVNPRLVERLRAADLIIYSPGTQHSSLFPSYLTPGLSEAIAANLTAIKLLITNLQADAEIVDSSAVDIVERAVYYLEEKGRLRIPTPCLITHYLINEPGLGEAGTPYVPLGRLDALEDPRLARIGHYEDGVTGHHDADKILNPFIESFLARRRLQTVAVLLYAAGSVNKLTQTILEMVRGGFADLPVEVTLFYTFPQPLDPTFVGRLPFHVRHLGDEVEADGAFREALAKQSFDYVLMFESSGMYRGEDCASLVTNLTLGRPDAVWGSRRLSVKEIHESYRLRYRHNVLLGMASYAGSHLLSVGYLLLHGRYISDTLSGARAVRTEFVRNVGIDLMHRRVNQYLLSALLGERAEVLEVPVRFLPLSPERVRRTSVVDGLRSLGTILWQRVAGRRRVSRRRPRNPARSVGRGAVASDGSKAR